MNTQSIFTQSAISLLLIAGITSFSAQASDVKYNYIEGRYLLDAELNSVDGDGIQLGGSYLINNDFYVIGSYRTLDFDFNNDIDTFEIGGGYILPIHTNWDANFTASLINMDINNNTENGFSLSAGVRGMVTPKFEARAKFNYIDVNDSDTFITVGGDYFVLPNLSVGVELELAGDLDTLSIGARYYF